MSAISPLSLNVLWDKFRGCSHPGRQRRDADLTQQIKETDLRLDVDQDPTSNLNRHERIEAIRVQGFAGIDVLRSGLEALGEPRAECFSDHPRCLVQGGGLSELGRYAFFEDSCVPSMGSSECAMFPPLRAENDRASQNWNYIQVHPSVQVEISAPIRGPL